MRAAAAQRPHHLHALLCVLARLDRHALERRSRGAVPVFRRRHVARLGAAAEGEAHAAVGLRRTHAIDRGGRVAAQVPEGADRARAMRAAAAQRPHHLHALL